MKSSLKLRNLPSMDEDIATLRGQAEGGRAAYRAGTIGRARATELVGPYLDAANTRSRALAAQYGQRPRLLTLGAYLR